MSTTAPPQIPPRPTRSQRDAAAAAASTIPEVPPRPAQKQTDRSLSPNNYPYSPLYDPPSTQNLGRSISNDASNLSLPARPPSVTLPSIGQEGNEYADINYGNTPEAYSVGPEAVAQMRNVDGDLKLHAPKPSLPRASAKAQVKAVTRTDDQQAAAHGFGKAGTPPYEEPDLFGRSSRPKATSIPGSGSQPSGSPSRRQSIAPPEDEQGPAELGLRVPINPNAGDVQAPSPAPFTNLADHHGPGRKRHHARTKSGREVHLPPGSYGLHGHGVHAHDKFDKDWYAKHPDQLVHEATIGHGHYAATGSGRGEWALSSEDLNKIVRDTASRGAGLGTNEGVISYPDEQIGFLASDQYSSRIATPAQGGGYAHKLHSNTSQPNFESPLRTTSIPTDNFQRNKFDKSKGSVSGQSDAVDSETEEDVIHVDDPARRYNMVTGGEETMNEAEDLGPNGGNTPEQAGYLDESGYGVPILASDEVAKDIGGEHMQPAVSPKHERRSSIHFVGDENGSGNITPTSRPTSRLGSTHGLQTLLSRFVSRHDDREEIHTPLEDVEEYEPLFPDEDESKKRPINAAERFKQRPDTLKHRFPSQDIWEDTPSSAMHVATITTPDPIAQNDSAVAKPVSNEFEDPSTESARKGEVDEADKAELLPKEERLAKSRFATHLRNDMPARPGMQQRFPSRDIWEDTPDSMQLVTTVASPPPPLGAEQKSPEDAASNKPSIPPRALNRSKLGESSTIPSLPVSAEVNQPQVPARPPKRMQAVPAANAKLHDVVIPPSQTLDKNITPTEATKGPGLPDRPKPPVPARPAKKESLEALTKARPGGSSGSQDTVASPPLPKAKPAIPARPGGNKPNLPTAFMSDLNQRLQLGPRPPTKEKEVEPAAEGEAARLPDARKNRARGPQRRAPAKPSSDLAEATPLPIPEFTISISRPIWSINEDEGLIVTNYEKASSLPQQSISKALAEDVGSRTTATTSTDAADAPTLLSSKGVSMSASNESVDPNQVDSATATPGAEKADPLNRSIGSIVREDTEGFPSLSEQTTASSGGTSGAPLERVESKNEKPSKSGTEVSGAGHVSGVEHNTLSETTTSSSLSSCERLKNVSTREPRAAADQRVGDNVLATDSGAKPLSQHEPPATTVETASIFENDDVNIGEGQEKEPGCEGTGHGEMRTESRMKTNIPDKKLEETTVMADGKEHAADGEGSVKGDQPGIGEVTAQSGCWVFEDFEQ